MKQTTILILVIDDYLIYNLQFNKEPIITQKPFKRIVIHRQIMKQNTQHYNKLNQNQLKNDCLSYLNMMNMQNMSTETQSKHKEKEKEKEQQKQSRNRYKYQWNGTLSQELIKQMIRDIWNIDVISIKHLVGYDVSNYLIEGHQLRAWQEQAQRKAEDQQQVSLDSKWKGKQLQMQQLQSELQSGNNNEHKYRKYIVKIYKNQTNQQRQILQAQNNLLQFLQSYANATTNTNTTTTTNTNITYNKYPKPIPIVKNTTQQTATIKNLPTIHAFPTQSAIHKFKSKGKNKKYTSDVIYIQSIEDKHKHKDKDKDKHKDIINRLQQQEQQQQQQRQLQPQLQLQPQPQLQTDKNICYDLQDNTVVYPLIGTTNSNIDTNIDAVIDVGIRSNDQYIANIQLISSYPCFNSQHHNTISTRISMRILEYIQGVMLGQYYEHISNKHNDKDKDKADNINSVDMDMLWKQLPKFVANSITLPLVAYTNRCISTISINADTTINGTVPHALLNRQWQWHIQSFLKHPQYYQHRYNMVCSNIARPSWHRQIIQYFVQLYQSVLANLNAQAQEQKGQLRKCIIYNDMNQWNVVIKAGTNQSQSMISQSYVPTPLQISVIDFGDIVHSYLIQDISIYTLYLIYHHPCRQFIHKHLLLSIKQYTNIIPITLSQLILYYITVPMRMCVSLCNSEYAMKDRQGDDYVGMSQSNGWELLRAMRDMYQEVDVNKEEQDKSKQKKQQEQICNSVNKILDSKLFKQLIKNTNITTNTGALHIDKAHVIMPPANSLTKISNINEGDDSEDYGQRWTQQDYTPWQQAPHQQKQHYNKQQYQHVRYLLNKYYANIVNNYAINNEQKQVSQAMQMQVQRCAGYSTKNFKITLPTQTPQTDAHAYILKVYIKENSRLQAYTQIQNKILSHILAHQLQKQNNKQDHGNMNMNMNMNMNKFILNVPKPMPINIKPNNGRDEYCIGFYDQFWNRDVIIRLLGYVHGCSYNSYISKLKLQDAVNHEHIDTHKYQIKQYSNHQISQQNNTCNNLHKFYKIVESFGSMLGTLDTQLNNCLQHLIQKGDDKKQLYRYLKRKDYEWYVEHTHIWIQYIDYVTDQRTKNNIKYFYQLYSDNVQSNIKKRLHKSNSTKYEQNNYLRTSLVHLDPTQDNCLINNPNSPNPQVDGIIDFDQIQVQYLINDLAVAIVHCFHSIPKIIKSSTLSKPSQKSSTNASTYKRNTLHPIYRNTLSILVSKYHSILPLNLEELRSLYYFVGARLSMCIILENRDILKSPDNHHIDFDLEYLKEGIDSLTKVDPLEFYQVLKMGCFGKQLKTQEQENEEFRIQGNCPVHIIHTLIRKFSEMQGQNCDIRLNQIQNILWNYDWTKIKLLSDQFPYQTQVKQITLLKILQQTKINLRQEIEANKIEDLLSELENSYHKYKIHQVK